MKPKFKVLTFRCPAVLDQNVEAYAAITGRMKSAVLIEAIRWYLSKEDRK
jgi:hypothetical protein